MSSVDFVQQIDIFRIKLGLPFLFASFVWTIIKIGRISRQIFFILCVIILIEAHLGLDQF